MLFGFDVSCFTWGSTVGVTVGVTGSQSGYVFMAYSSRIVVS